jgi:AcrR family transcriptional regulator
MTRPYRLGKRAVQSAETRQRIIDAARELILHDGAYDTSLDAVARRANSTRTTVYHQFGSREELLLAVLNEALDRADVREVRKALQHRDAVQAMRRTIRASCRFWAGEHALFAQVKGLAGIDDGMAAIDALKEGVRRGHITNLARRLAHEGNLRAGCSERRALDTLLFVTSFETFHQLFKGARMPTDVVGTMLLELAERTLLP